MSDDVEQPTKGPSWINRRRVIITSLILCAFFVIYVMMFGDDTRVNESIILGSFALASTVIGAYCFAAVWDDKTDRRQIAGGPKTVNYTGRPTTTVRKSKSKPRGADSPDA